MGNKMAKGVAQTNEKEVYSREKNPVADMNNWTEAIRKETRNHHLNEKFAIYPNQIQIISEEPNNIKWKRKGEEETEEEKKKKKVPTPSQVEFEDTLQKNLKAFYSTPKLKYKNPLTAS